MMMTEANARYSSGKQASGAWGAWRGGVQARGRGRCSSLLTWKCNTSHLRWCPSSAPVTPPTSGRTNRRNSWDGKPPVLPHRPPLTRCPRHLAWHHGPSFTWWLQVESTWTCLITFPATANAVSMEACPSGLAFTALHEPVLMWQIWPGHSRTIPSGLKAQSRFSRHSEAHDHSLQLWRSPPLPWPSRQGPWKLPLWQPPLFGDGCGHCSMWTRHLRQGDRFIEIWICTVWHVNRDNMMSPCCPCA